MKLLLCVHCSDVVSLRADTISHCFCGKSSGYYQPDGLNAVIKGTAKDKVFCLGFANSSLVEALRTQIAAGDKTNHIWYGGKMTVPGRDFSAFIIPYCAPTVKYEYETPIP